ncbi:MAG: J domain-containing protein, partial [Gemmatimonadetes bacterium]|nr:J domain-containing protein [Gemmatimonadota bacterium]
EAEIELTLEQLLAGGKTEFSLRDAQGKTRTLSVGIPPGTTQGTRIRLGGQGSPGAGGGPAGDLLLRIRVAEHPRFALEGTDLRETLDVTPWEAALGAKVEVKTLDGAVDLKIPPGTPSERVFRLRGLGLRRTADQRGDLLVKLRIVVPPEPTDDERRLFEELAEKSSFRPRGS